MNWWVWAIAGALLLCAELAFIDAQFYLVFIGFSAILVGLAGMFGAGLPAWAQWVLFGALAIISVTTFRRVIYDRLRRDAPDAVQSGPAGESLTLPTRLAPGDSCQVEYRGSHWTVTNDAAAAIEAGARARIERVRGLTLIVHPDV